VHAVAGGPSAGVEEERLALFVQVQDGSEFPVKDGAAIRRIRRVPFSSPMGKEDSSTEKQMWLPTRQLLEAIQQGLVDQACAKLLNQLLVVDGNLWKKDLMRNCMRRMIRLFTPACRRRLRRQLPTASPADRPTPEPIQREVARWRSCPWKPKGCEI
jgi:hypothetical protein